MTKTYLFLFVSAVSLLLLYVWFLRDVDLLIVATGVLFLIHFLQDEVFTFGRKHSLFTTLEALPILLIYSGFLIDAVKGTTFVPLFSLMAAIVVIAHLLLSFLKKRRMDAVSFYFYSATIVLLGIALSQVSFRAEILLGFIIIFHYVNWYLFFYNKVRSNAREKKKYIRRMFFINTAVVLLFLIYSNSVGVLALQFLFLPTYFYAGTILHILFSVRLGEYKQSLLLHT